MTYENISHMLALIESKQLKESSFRKAKSD